jgi:hypothetical protein
MEVLAGIIFTLCVEFIGYKIYQSRERRKARSAYVPPSRLRTDMRIKDYPDKRQED